MSILLRVFVVFALFLLLVGIAPASQAAVPSVVSPLRPVKLRCGYRTDPLGIDDPHPSLSWISVSRTPEVRDQHQSAYEVQVASSTEKLSHGVADLYDSSKVLSDRSVEVKYTGRPLRSNEPCFWRVRVWDQAGRPSAWSASALWTMGVLSPSDWKAQWIDAAPDSRQWGDFTLDTSFTIQHEAASVYLRAASTVQTYMWQISITADHPTLRPHARINGNWEVLKTVPLGNGYTSADFQKPHTLRITATGNTITTYLDGHLIDTTIDDKRVGGTIGFRASGTEAATFQNVRVTSPEGNLLYDSKLVGAARNPFTGGTRGPDGLTVTNTDAMLDSANLRTPMLRHGFALAQHPIRRAWLYASALGTYSASLNGKRVGDHYFAPGWTNYYRRVQYQCYDVTKMLKPGGNAIGVQLAPG